MSLFNDTQIKKKAWSQSDFDNPSRDNKAQHPYILVSSGIHCLLLSRAIDVRVLSLPVVISYASF